MTDPSTALDRRDRIAGVTRVLDLKRPEIENSIPTGVRSSLSFDRLRSLTQLALARSPQIAQCEVGSIVLSVMEAALLGLEVGSPRGVYLVPYKNTCTPIVGVWGLAELLLRAGDVSRIVTRCVYEGDEFAFNYGLNERLVHVPAARSSPGKLIAVYAVLHFRDGGAPQFDVMYKADVDRIRGRSRASTAGPWVTDYDAMAEKTVLRRLSKRVRQTPEISAALELDNRAEGTVGGVSEALDRDVNGEPIPGDLEEADAAPAPAPEKGVAGLRAKLQQRQGTPDPDLEAEMARQDAEDAS